MPGLMNLGQAWGNNIGLWAGHGDISSPGRPIGDPGWWDLLINGWLAQGALPVYLLNSASSSSGFSGDVGTIQLGGNLISSQVLCSVSTVGQYRSAHDVVVLAWCSGLSTNRCARNRSRGVRLETPQQIS
jgi:hypothetical protein